MTSNEARAATLARALRATIDGDRDAFQTLFTDDVRAWTPALSTTSLSELIEALDRRDDAFSDIELDVVPLDVGSWTYTCVEWSVDMIHTGIVALHDGTRIDPTGIRVTVHGVTVAEFHGDRICCAAAVLGRTCRARAARRPHGARREQLCSPGGGGGRLGDAMDSPGSADSGRGLVVSLVPRPDGQGRLRTRRVPALAVGLDQPQGSPPGELAQAQEVVRTNRRRIGAMAH